MQGDDGAGSASLSSVIGSISDKKLEAELKAAEVVASRAQKEVDDLKAEAERVTQRDAGAKAADGEYLKNIVLGYARHDHPNDSTVTCTSL